MSSLEEVDSGKDLLEESYFARGTWSSQGSLRRPSPRVSCRPAGTQTHRPCSRWPGVGTGSQHRDAQTPSQRGLRRQRLDVQLPRWVSGPPCIGARTGRLPARASDVWKPLCPARDPGLGCAAALSEALSPRKHTLWAPTV